MKSVFTLELEKMAKRLLGKYEDGCGEVVIYTKDKSTVENKCGFWEGKQRVFCYDCAEIIDNCKNVLKDGMVKNE